MKKMIKRTLVILLVLTLSVSTALLAYLYFLAPDAGRSAKEQDLSGAWTARPDMTERAAVTALGWLQDIEAVSVSLEDMKSYMKDLTVQVNLEFEQTAYSEGTAEGTFYSVILPESYDACNQAAYDAFAAVFRDLVTERLLMAGYTGSTDEDTVEALVMETFGMSTVSYLMSYAPALLPSLEELQEQYDGSGTYEAADGILTRRFDAGTSAAAWTECFIRRDGSLVLYDETDPTGIDPASGQDPVIYTLQQPQEEPLPD